MAQQRVLVAGAGGRLGQLVIEQLLAAGVIDIIATTRSPRKLASFADRNIEVRAGDFNDPHSLEEAFFGADRMLLISTDDLFSGRRVQQHTNAIRAAVNAGVGHILYTSMPDPIGSKAVPFAPDHVATEEALRNSGVGYTSLRVAWYAENPIELGLVPAALRSGKWITAVGDGKIPYVARFDVARAAAAALTSATALPEIYDISGPSAQTAEELAADLSGVTGKSIEVVHVDPAILETELIAAGVPAMLAPMLSSTDANTRSGKFDLVSSAVTDLTGEPPIEFYRFLWAIRDQLK